MPKKKLASKISGIWHGFVDGIKSVFTMQHKWLFVLYTVLIWGLCHYDMVAILHVQ